jgi:CBS domain-containing protein
MVEYSGVSEQDNAGTAVGAVDYGALQAKDAMQYGVVSIGKDRPVSEAIRLLLDKRISGLAVADEGRVEGILSEKDVLRLLYEKEYLPGTVQDYMSTDVVTFDVEDNFAFVCRWLAKHDFRRVPILREGQLAGMITRADVIRVYRARCGSPRQAMPQARYRDQLLARDAMTHGLLTVGRDTPLCEAVDILCVQHVTGLPVVDEGMHLQGMITEKDVLRCIGDADALDSTVQDHMTDKVVAFEQDAPLSDVCECLIRNNFRRVPILSHGRLVGVLARADIIRKMTTVFKRSMTDR